jgi:hypothetical protein
MEARSVIEVVEYDEAWPVRAAAARADRGLPPVPVWEE